MFKDVYKWCINWISISVFMATNFVYNLGKQRSIERKNDEWFQHTHNRISTPGIILLEFHIDFFFTL